VIFKKVLSLTKKEKSVNLNEAELSDVYFQILKIGI